MRGESREQVAELNRVLDETAASYQELQQEHAATLDELAWYKRWAYGRRRERVAEDKGQGHLFDLDPDLPANGDQIRSSRIPDDTINVQGHRRQRKRREIDWDKLPQIRHEHDLSPEEKTCSCCGRPMDRIGEDVTRELELQPAKLEAHIHVRPKYACRCCKHGVCCGAAATATGSRRHRRAGAGLRGDRRQVRRSSAPVPPGRHPCPLRRLHRTQHALRLGEVRRRTLQAALRSATPAGPAIDGNVDRRHPGDRVWAVWRAVFKVTSGPTSATNIPMRCTTSRRVAAAMGRHNSCRVSRSILHADAFTGYDAIFLGPQAAIQEVACWVHARRKFFDAVKSYPREAHQVLEWIRQLYDIEDRSRTWSAEARLQLRLVEAIPILDKIESLPGGTGLEGVAQEQPGQGRPLRPQPVGRTTPLRGRWPSDDRQQCERADATAPGHRPKELVVPGQ